MRSSLDLDVYRQRTSGTFIPGSAAAYRSSARQRHHLHSVAFPGSERAPTLAEVQEVLRRLTAAGYNTGGTDGRVGNDTMAAVLAYQKKVGLAPAGAYAWLKLLMRLRQGA
jgi:peptidoglycan hydrolase-like protein with peptidoglycan-binding domain